MNGRCGGWALRPTPLLRLSHLLLLLVLLLLLLLVAPRPASAEAEQCTAQGGSEASPPPPFPEEAQMQLQSASQQSQEGSPQLEGPDKGAAAPAAAEGNVGQPALLALPSGNGDATQFGLGQTLKLDALGPIIVNSDGTTSRIVNWANLTERERQVALRRIAARNKERAAQLSEGNNNL
jgi:hypothetical protein